MTRETKIGLLVGLGFIVVFAVLLSQTTSVPSTGENLPFVLKPSPQLPSLPSGREVANKPSGSSGDRAVPAPGVGRTPESPSTPVDRDGGLVRLPNSPDSSSKGPDGVAWRLPNPPSLGPSPFAWTPNGGGSTPLSGQMPSSEGDPDVVTTSYVGKRAPSPVGPSVVGTAPPGPSVAVKHPESTDLAKGMIDAPKPVAVDPDELVKSPDPAPASPPKEYLVQKGDTLRSIAKGRYDSVSAKVVEFVADANKDRIKDKNRVFEGQKLLLPDLPPDMFEVVQPVGGKRPSLRELAKELTTVDSRKAPQESARPKSGSTAPLSAGTAVVKGGTDGREASGSPSPQVVDYPKLTPRKKVSSPTLTPAPAPSPAPDDADDRRAPTVIARNDGGALKGKLTLDSTELKPAAASSKYRTYEIRDKDTLGSIAARELGTATAWPEIKKLNKDLDPRKMKAGMKIKLPARPSVPSPSGTSSRPEVNRASA
ncbi:MAG: LysM peptidoglycan-binding domain-containing protein [Phycisphaerae bacterium]|nr:LysM peptidoglycan-binding domain-containing protein [Phycisphaerae bacterium]